MDQTGYSPQKALTAWRRSQLVDAGRIGQFL